MVFIMYIPFTFFLTFENICNYTESSKSFVCFWGIRIFVWAVRNEQYVNTRETERQREKKGRKITILELE